MNTGLGQFIPFVFYGGILITCALSLLYRPEFGLYLVVLLLPLQTTRDKLASLPLGQNVVFLLLLSALVGAFLRRDQTFLPHSRVNKWVLALVVYNFGSLWYGCIASSQPPPLWISDPRFAAWKDYMALPLLYFVSSVVLRDRKQLRWMMILMCISVVAVNYSAVREIASHDLSHFYESKRNGGPLGYAGSNGLAVFEANVSLVLMVLLGGRVRRIVKIGLLLLLATSLYCVTFSFSREAYLALVIGFFAFAIMRQRKLLIVLGLFLSFYSTLLPISVQERIAGTNTEGRGLDESSQERVELWKDAVHLIEESPFFGYGFNTYRFMNRLGPLHDTHNFYVKATVEGGLVGLFIFVGLLATMASQAYKMSRGPDKVAANLGLACFLCVASTAIANFFGDRWTYIEVNGFLWVLVAMLGRYSTLLADDRMDHNAIGDFESITERTDSGVEELASLQ